MPQTITSIKDAELQRLKRNQTDAQKKNSDATKEGVVVNSFYKEPKTEDIHELYDSLVISDSARMPEKLKEQEQTTKEKKLLPISLIAIGTMGLIAGMSHLVNKSAVVNPILASEKKLDHLTRNISITNELYQGVYQLIKCPNKKTLLAASGVLALTSMGFIGKMFVDGCKEVWVKKREADIQKNLQENLVAVETQSFSGKIQIIRGMLSEKAREFGEYLCDSPKTPITFKKLMSFDRTYFSGKNNNENKPKTDFNYFALGALTVASIAALGFLSIRNLNKGKRSLEGYIKKTQDSIKTIIKKSTNETRAQDEQKLKNMFLSIDSSSGYIQKELKELNWDKKPKEKFIEELTFDINKSTTKADKAMAGDGTPKPAFNSYVSDYKAFFYNYLLDSDNPQFKMLFLSTTGLTALGYTGKAVGEAMKEVQVKKINAETELDLQKRLVATELRNFKAKKDAAIDPLCEEFYNQVQKGKAKQELKTMAENILFEVKNGPPFVYS